MSQDKKMIVERFLTELWEERDLDIVDEVLAENYVDHSLPEKLPPNREGFKQFAKMYHRAFPNIDTEVEDVIIEGDKVAMRWSARGVHKGEFMDIPPTNKPVEMTGINILRFSGNKVVESWNEFDQVGMLQQIGAMPEPETA
jgi:predicted ester cyclase